MAGGVELSDDSDAAQAGVLDHSAHVAGCVHVGHGIEGSLGTRESSVPCSGAEAGICSPELGTTLIKEHYLLAELWECGALIGERWVIHNVPVKHVELVVSHDVLGRNRDKDEHAPSLLKGHPACHR